MTIGLENVTVEVCSSQLMGYFRTCVDQGDRGEVIGDAGCHAKCVSNCIQLPAVVHQGTFNYISALHHPCQIKFSQSMRARAFCNAISSQRSRNSSFFLFSFFFLFFKVDLTPKQIKGSPFTSFGTVTTSCSIGKSNLGVLKNCLL